MPLIVVFIIDAYKIFGRNANQREKQKGTNELNISIYINKFKWILFYRMTLIDACKINWQILFRFQQFMERIWYSSFNSLFFFTGAKPLNSAHDMVVVQYIHLFHVHAEAGHNYWNYCCNSETIQRFAFCCCCNFSCSVFGFVDISNRL